MVCTPLHLDAMLQDCFFPHMCQNHNCMPGVMSFLLEWFLYSEGTSYTMSGLPLLDILLGHTYDILERDLQKAVTFRLNILRTYLVQCPGASRQGDNQGKTFGRSEDVRE
mmetsp:Transcript_123539/g.224572  ORF Transcript_123539/g.224572 Transcript_123539/m.224572 type:complete len:110 (-) Transcript_123539:67-396(-)